MKPGFLAEKRDVYDAVLGLRLRQFLGGHAPGKDSLDGIFQLVERARARTLQDQILRLSQSSSRGGEHQAMKDLAERMSKVSARRIQAQPGEAERLDQELAELESEYLLAERRLHDATSNDRLADPVRAWTIAETQARLNPGTLLLSIWTGRESLSVLWITRQSSGVTMAPFTQRERQSVTQFCEGLAGGGAANWRPAARHIAAWLLKGITPLEDPAIRHLVIVPDGMLQLLPMEVLPGPDNRLLVERFDIAYLPASSLLFRRWPAPLWAPPRRLQLVAYGDPVSAGAPKGGVIPGDERWLRLPRARQEIESIARVVNGRARLYAGAAAQKVRLTQESLREIPLLHFSTHAVSDREDPTRTRMLFSSPASEEGFDYLFLPEIYGLDLHGVELVTLSACETEQGRFVRGEGVRSLGRAFLATGARSTVTSLWGVDDDAAAQFMERFYYFLARGYAKADALRRSKLEFLESDSRLENPYYWSAFVLTGDAGPLARVLPWHWVLLAAALACLAVWAAAVVRRRISAGALR